MNYLVKCSAAVANTRSDGSGVRRVRIFKGTAKERLVEIGRAGVKFAAPLPPEVLADAELVAVEIASDKPQRLALEAANAEAVAAMSWPDLADTAEKHGIKTNGVKKEKVRAELIAKLADQAKAAAAAGDGEAADDRKGDRAQREASAEETAAILAAEGVQPGDEIELADGEKYRVVSMDDVVVIEPVATAPEGNTEV